MDYYTVIFYKVLRRNDLQNVLLSEKSEVQNHTVCIVLAMRKGGKEYSYVHIICNGLYKKLKASATPSWGTEQEERSFSIFTLSNFHR